MRPGEHLDDCRDAILLDPRDHAGEAVSSRLADDPPLRLRPAPLGQQPANLLKRHRALPARAAPDLQSTCAPPASNGLHGHAEHLGGFADAQLAAVDIWSSARHYLVIVASSATHV